MDQLTAHLDRGWDLVQRGDLLGAMISAQKGLELDADSPDAHNLMGYVHAAEGNVAEALEHYRHAIALDDTYFDAMVHAAELLIHPLGQTQEAVALMNEALDFLEDADEIADAILVKVDAYLHSGDVEGAGRALRALPPGPFTRGPINAAIGRAWFELGSPESARLPLEAALTTDPDLADAHYYLGLISEAEGNHEAAVMSLLRARQLDGGAPRPAWAISSTAFEEALQASIPKIREPLGGILEGALVVVADLPGPEIVADGVDPRTPLLLDDLQTESGKVRAGRLFVYQRNIERAYLGNEKLDAVLIQCIEHELESFLKQHSSADASLN